MPTPPRRFALPLILAVLGAAAVAFGHAGLPVACALLFCPGWGAARLLSVADRNFGVFGAAICTSILLLGLAPRLPFVGRDDLMALVAVSSVVLCLAGTWRMRRYDRWLEMIGRPNDPMPLWPARTPMCIGLAIAALAAIAWARPLGTASLDGHHLDEAAAAFGWLRMGENPLVAGTPLPDGSLVAGATATLAAATRLHPLVCVGLISLAALAAVLAFVAEGISRLWGNRGGTRAMLAFLIGMNPLGTFFMLGAHDIEGARAAMSPGFGDGISTALQPFVDGSPLCVTLAFVAMMQSCTLSILRRSSTHIPRLLGLSTFALVLSSPSAAMLLVPGWIVGIGLSHIACLGSIDNDPQLNASVRRRGEPLVLRSPFWRPVLHMTIGLALAWLFVSIPDIPPQANARPVAWALLSAIGPACLLFMPGIRHLNASPGREAYFFVGLVVVTVTLMLTFDVFSGRGSVGVRLLSLLLAVPCANGAMKMIEIYGLRARLSLALLVVALLPATVVVLLATHRTEIVAVVAPRPDAQLAVAVDSVPGIDLQALADVRAIATDDTVLALPVLAPTRAHASLATLLAGVPLLAQTTTPIAMQRRLLVDRLHRGDATATWTLLADADLSHRTILTVDNVVWPGFEVLSQRNDGLAVQRARRGAIVLVTADRLTIGDLSVEHLPSFAPHLDKSMIFEQAVTPRPSVPEALAVLLAVDAADEPARRPLPLELVERGGRAAAWLATDDSALDRALRAAFVDGWHVAPERPIGKLVGEALTWIGDRADTRPPFAWIHVGDVTTPGARNDLDSALYRLLAELPPDTRLILTSPRGVPTAPTGEPTASSPSIPAALTEPALRVPLLIHGGGAPATRTTRLVSLADVWHLLTAGSIPDRKDVSLRWTDPLTNESFTGLRTRTTKVINVPADAAGAGAGAWTIDLTSPFGETSPTWTPTPVSSSSDP